MKRRTKVLWLVLIVIVLLGGSGIVAMRHIEGNLERLVNMPIGPVDMARVADGSFQGSYAMFPVSASVEVTVSEQVITGIKLLEHRHGQGADAEVMSQRVLETQSLQVDTVTGATYSSKVILKAIAEALEAGSQ